jgi:hypothetical protein
MSGSKSPLLFQTVGRKKQEKDRAQTARENVGSIASSSKIPISHTSLLLNIQKPVGSTICVDYTPVYDKQVAQRKRANLKDWPFL